MRKSSYAIVFISFFSWYRTFDWLGAKANVKKYDCWLVIKVSTWQPPWICLSRLDFENLILVSFYTSQQIKNYQFSRIMRYLVSAKCFSCCGNLAGTSLGRRCHIFQIARVAAHFLNGRCTQQRASSFFRFPAHRVREFYALFSCLLNFTSVAGIFSDNLRDRCFFLMFHCKVFIASTFSLHDYGDN